MAPAVEAEVEPAAPRKAGKRAGEGSERVLRVTADRLNSLLDLSSKSLVETQRLKPYLATLQRLKRMHGQGMRALDGLKTQLEDSGQSPEVLDALAQTQRTLNLGIELRHTQGAVAHRAQDAEGLEVLQHGAHPVLVRGAIGPHLRLVHRFKRALHVGDRGCVVHLGALAVGAQAAQCTIAAAPGG
jgi:hypothetical protein